MEETSPEGGERTVEMIQRYAIRRLVSLDQINRARDGLSLLTVIQEDMLAKISWAAEFEVAPDRVNTLIRPWPRKIGEKAIHYNSLIPRSAIEIEMVTTA